MKIKVVSRDKSGEEPTKETAAGKQKEENKKHEQSGSDLWKEQNSENEKKEEIEYEGKWYSGLY